MIGAADGARALLAAALLAPLLLMPGLPPPSIAAGPTPTALPYRDPRQPVEVRVQDLLARMTLDEKFWQLFMVADSPFGDFSSYPHGAFGLQLGPGRDSLRGPDYVDAVQRHFVEKTRLGIPIIVFGEALHGLVREGTTVFPQAIGLAASFNPDLMARVAAAIAEESRAEGIRLVLSPVVNIASDVRWGRVEETYGEDPYLASEMGVAFVRAFERRGIITTPKHFLANAGDGGRDSYPIHWNERLLRELYLPPFTACIARGGSRGLMSAYNSLDGRPCSASGWLNHDLLRGELDRDLLIISDAGGVGGANVLHFTAKDYADAGAQALVGGLDVLFQTSPDHAELFLPAFRDGRIPMEVIDRAVARVLRLKFELGLFDEPYVPAVAPPYAAHRDLAREAARASIVLLKNEERALPLDPKLPRVAVLGPDAAETRLGGYSGPGRDPVSVLEGICRRIGAERVLYAPGCSRLSPGPVVVPEEFLACTEAGEFRPGLRGEYFDNIELSGAPVLTRIDPRVDGQWTLFSPDPERLPFDHYAVRWTGRLRAPITGHLRLGVEGSDGFRLYLDGELLIDRRAKVSYRRSMVERRFVEGEWHDLRLEFVEPSGHGRVRLVWELPATGAAEEDQALAEAVRLAEQSDAIIVVAGIEEGEFRDRAFLGLPGRQPELIQRLAALGKPVVVVLVGGSAITMHEWIDAVPAVLDVWYPGEAGGEAVAEILFGDANPAGRLPITFPVAEGQVPLVYHHKPTGRGDDYLDLSGQPLFPFGHGLSFTTFDYGDLSIVPPVIAVGDSAIVRCRVTNTGTRAGDEVVQLYLRDELASVARPLLELKDFARVRLEPGETREVRFNLTPEMLSMLDIELRRVIEPGTFRVLIGSSSREIRLRQILTVEGAVSDGSR